MEAFGKRTAAEWKEILKEADVAFSVAQSWEEILGDPRAWANNCFYKMKYDNGNERTLVRPPVKFQEMGVPEYRRGPLIGENSYEVMAELGYSQEQIKDFAERGIIYKWEKK